MSNESNAKTQLTGLVKGMYSFELKVSDAGGLFSKDTVQIEVNEGVVVPSVDTTFTDLIWNLWHQPGLPDTVNAFDEVYLQIPENFFLNLSDSSMQVFVRTDSSSDWIEAHQSINGHCDPSYKFLYISSSMSVHVCPLDHSLIGKKASVRVVIK